MSLDSPSTRSKKLSRARSSSISRTDSGSMSENRNYSERLVKRIVEHVAYREAVRREPKIVECLELYQQDMWEDEHLKKAEKLAQQQSKSTTKKKRTTHKSSSTSSNRENGHAHTRQQAPAKGKDKVKSSMTSSSSSSSSALPRSTSSASGHSGMYDFGELMKQAKTLQQFETTGKKPKKSKKNRRPDTVDGSVGFRERSQSVAHIEDVGSGKSGRGGSRLQRRMSVPSRSDYRAARYSNSLDSEGSSVQTYPFPNPNIFSLAGCGSNQLLQRVLYLACQQNETIKFEKKVRKERERTSQMPVLSSSVHIQLLCAKATAKDKSTSQKEKSWSSYF